jgi:hypothetical protein
MEVEIRNSASAQNESSPLSDPNADTTTDSKNNSNNNERPVSNRSTDHVLNQNEIDSSSPRERNPVNPHCLAPTPEFTKYQIGWVVIQTIGSAGICFAANIGICTVAMMGQEVSLFKFPIPMAGAYAIVILIEVLLNWFISGCLLSLDVLNGRISPVKREAIPWWPSTDSYWEKNGYMNISELIAPTFKHAPLLQRLKSHLWIMLPWILYVFILLYPLALLISYLVWGLYRYREFNLQPEILCAFLGSMIAIITVPIWSIMALASVGEKYLNDNSESYLNV